MLYDSPQMLAGGRGNTGLTASEKLTIVANRYNMPGLLQMQPSEQNIYDSIDCATLSIAGSSTVTFFSGVNNKAFPLTNLQQNQLKAGNVIVVMYVQFAIITFNSNYYTGGTISNIRTLEECVSATASANLKPILASQMTLVVGSSEVFKDLPIINAYAGFNPNASFGVKSESPASGNAVVQYGSSNIDLASEPVILPQLEFKLNLQVPQLAAVPGTGLQFLRATIGGFGTIPAMKSPM